MSDEYGVMPVLTDLSLPQSPEACFDFRLRLGEALQHLMGLKAACDETIAEYMGDRTEAVVMGETYSYMPSSSKWEYEPLSLIATLTKLQGDGQITQADYDEAVELVPVPDRLVVRTTKIKALVNKRGLEELEACRTHIVGPKRLKRVI